MESVNKKKSDSTRCDIPGCSFPKVNGYHCAKHQPEIWDADWIEKRFPEVAVKNYLRSETMNDADNKKVPEAGEDDHMHSVWEGEGGRVQPVLHELPEDRESTADSDPPSVSLPGETASAPASPVHQEPIGDKGDEVQRPGGDVGGDAPDVESCR